MLCVPLGKRRFQWRASCRPIPRASPSRSRRSSARRPMEPLTPFDFVVCTPRWFADEYERADLRHWGETAAPLRGDLAGGQILGRAIFRPSDERDPVVFGTGLVFMRRW